MKHTTKSFSPFIVLLFSVIIFYYFPQQIFIGNALSTAFILISLSAAGISLSLLIDNPSVRNSGIVLHFLLLSLFVFTSY